MNLKRCRLLILLALVATGWSPPSERVDAASCVGSPHAYWKMDEYVGDQVLDEAGNGFTLSAYGPFSPNESADVPPSTGVSPNLHSFFFSSGNEQAFQTNRPVEDDFTLCAWFKTTDVGSFDEHWATMALFHSESGGIDNDFGFGIDTQGRLAFGNGDVDGIDYSYSGATSVNTGDWTHGCVTRQRSTGDIRIYVNGVLDGQGTGSTRTLDSNPLMQIGFGTDSATFFDGNIDEARVYNSVLSAEQIAAIADGTFSCAADEETEQEQSQPMGAGGHRGSRTNIDHALKMRAQKMRPSAPHPAPSSTARVQKEVLSETLRVRTCGRVKKFFSANSLKRVNDRLQKRFGFQCS